MCLDVLKISLKVNGKTSFVVGGEAIQRKCNRRRWKDRTTRQFFTQYTVPSQLPGNMLGWEQAGAAA